MATVAVVGLVTLSAPRPAQAQFGGAVAIVSDLPRKLSDLASKISKRLEKLLKIAGDVAYKTSVRIFYRQLAAATTQFVMTAGTGQRPLFLTDPHYFTNVFDSAQADFLDNLETDYYGKEVSDRTPARKRLIGLLTHAIVEGQSACEEQCQQTYLDGQQIAKEMQRAVEFIRPEAENPKVTGGVVQNVFCPVIKDAELNRYIYTGADQEQKTPYTQLSLQTEMPPSACLQELQRQVSSMSQLALANYRACLETTEEGCPPAVAAGEGGDQNALTTEEVRKAVDDLFNPRNNDLGTTIKVLNKAGVLADEKVTTEKAALSTSVGPIRTKSGLVSAPASLAQKRAEQALTEATGDVPVVTGSKIADVISTAFNAALIQRITNEWFLKTCGLNPAACKSPTGTSKQARSLFSSNPTSLTQTTAARLVTGQLARPQFIIGDPSRSGVAVIDQLEADGLIDQRFHQAIEQKLTVREALDQGLLDGNRIFGFDRNQQEPADGYPYSTILYLRKYRIVPVGWELAAKFTRDFENPRTEHSLPDLTAAFNICGQDAEHDADPASTAGCSNDLSVSCSNPATDCPAQPTPFCNSTSHICDSGPQVGQACTTNAECAYAAPTCVETFSPSPFCGLVDPDWVLKAPLTYCRKQGAGEQLISKTFVCDEDTNGNGRIDCGTGDRGGDVGRFEYQRKDDACVDEPTCVAENEDGSCVAYGYCFEDRRTYRFDGEACPAYDASCEAFTTSAGTTAAYLTKTVDRNGCSADNAGCLAYCNDRRNDDGSFLCQKLPSADPANVVTAVRCPTGTTCTCRVPGGESCTVAAGGTSCTTQSGLPCDLGKNYSYFDRDVASCGSDAAGCRSFIDTRPPSNLLANGSFERFEGTVDDGVNDCIKGWDTTCTAGGGNFEAISSDLALTTNDTTAVKVRAGQELAFTNDRTPPGLDTGRPLARQTFTLSFYGKVSAGSCAAPFGLRSDPSVDLDDTVAGTQNVRQTSASLTTDWTRFTMVAYLPDGVYDNDPTKHRLQVFVRPGCEAIVDDFQLEASDAASTYREYASVNAVNLKQGRRSCNRVDVGCERYTSIDGSEAINGVANWPDRCAAEDAGCRQYREEPITHVPQRAAADPINLVAASGKVCTAAEVGCEEYTNLDLAAQGGEAREYYTSIRQCVKPVSGATDQSTYFSWVGDDRSGYQLKSYRLKHSNTDAGPCTNIALGTSTSDNNPACVDTAATTASCTAADIGVNPDCVEFFDSNGTVFRRLLSRTIPVTDDCHPYRNTIDQTAGGNTIYHILASESPTCSAEAAKCRQFTGNAGGNTQTIFSDTFEGSSVVTNAWTGVAGGSASYSTQSVNAGGHSMDARGTVATLASVLTGKVQQNASYTLSFWAKPSGTSAVLDQAYLQTSGTTTTQYALAGLGKPRPTLAAEWHPYTVGPVTVDGDPQTSQFLGLRFTDAGGADVDVFVDNITLTEITDSLFLIDGTYRTCADSELGCTAYRDRTGTTQYLKNFTRLCSQDVVGCSALFDTQNSSTPFQAPPFRGVAVPGDQTLPLVVDSNQFCAADQVGCSAFGLPARDLNGGISGYETVYLKDEPDRYVQILCTVNEVMCQEFTSNTSGAKLYFVDPGTNTCEYKRASGDTEFHWYMTGTTYRCPTVTPPKETVPIGHACAKACVGGARDGQACAISSDCPASAGTCNSSSRCVGGVLDGTTCATDADCTRPAGTCVGYDAAVGRTCAANSECKVCSNNGNPCTSNGDCNGGLCGGVCSSWTGVCAEEQSGCNEYRDPSDPNPCRSNCALETTKGSPVPVDDSCNPTTCLSGAKVGSACTSNADCPGVGACSTTSSNAGAPCTVDAECPSGACAGITPGTCSGEGIPGCRSYYYLRQSVEQNANQCNGRIDVQNGCRPFNDTSNSTLNYRSF